MVKVKTKNWSKITGKEQDSAYFLKLVVYLILGSIWLRVTNEGQTFQLPIPVGMLVGLLLATHDKFQIDRKIEYAILLVAMFVSFWLPLGLTFVL